MIDPDSTSRPPQWRDRVPQSATARVPPAHEPALECAPIFPGAERAGSYRVPEYLRQFTKTHAIITFSEPVVGPVLIGAGRYVGLGLMAGLDANDDNTH